MTSVSLTKAFSQAGRKFVPFMWRSISRVVVNLIAPLALFLLLGIVSLWMGASSLFVIVFSAAILVFICIWLLGIIRIPYELTFDLLDGRRSRWLFFNQFGTGIVLSFWYLLFYLPIVVLWYLSRGAALMTWIAYFVAILTVIAALSKLLYTPYCIVDHKIGIVAALHLGWRKTSMLVWASFFILSLGIWGGFALGFIYPSGIVNLLIALGTLLLDGFAFAWIGSCYRQQFAAPLVEKGE
ncbi:MAG: hypothetical protein JW725_04665 [Candidatus Babeliaceae bacterium]|nr:hypothetical protein [Candidatus Babeliaceae bacterium]